MSSDIHAIEQHRPGPRLDQALDRTERARLARSIGPQEPEDLTTADLEADIVDGSLGTIGHRKVADRQDHAQLRAGDARPGTGDLCGAGLALGHRRGETFWLTLDEIGGVGEPRAGVPGGP